MAREIYQPDIARPEGEEWIVWAESPAVYDRWVRDIAPQLGIDARKVALGHVLKSIVGDDGSVFFLSGAGYFNREQVGIMHDTLVIRLGWEVGVPELPMDVRQSLSGVLDVVRDADWNDGLALVASRDAWRTAVGEIDARIDSDTSLKSAVSYYVHAHERLASYWSRFMDGEGKRGE
jgi:hypothetical protein